MADLNSKMIVTAFEKRISEGVKSNSTKLMNIVTKYIDKNSQVLFDIGPVDRLYFSDEDRNVVFDMMKISPIEITKVVKECPVIDSKWKISSNEFNILMTLIIREYSKLKKKKEAEYALSYLTCYMYSSIHFKYFQYEPNRNIMTYTVNNLSNKYLIKQLGSLYKALHATATKSHDTYQKSLIEGTDKNIVDYLNNLKTRLDNNIKNIASEFYKNHEKGNYMNLEQDNYDEDNYFIADNTSFAINRIADKATIQLLTRGIDQDLARKSANMNGVSVNAIRNAMNDLITKKDSQIKELITLILQLYLMDGKHSVESVGGTKFIIFCLELYGKNNTVDTSILRIKDLLDKWLDECSEQYRKTERAATLSAYRKAIYTYFVFLINSVSK